MSDSFLLWLTSNEIEKYHQVLLDNDINTVDIVKTLSTDDLKELGVSLGDRKRFEKACLVSEATYSDFEQEIITYYPYVIAYPFKRMLDEPDGRNRLELMAYSFLNLMKYTGLVLASEYFHSSLRSKELNELFRNNLYQPSFGNWNAFVREAIKILSANNLSFIFPEIVQAYSAVEINKAKKYSVESEFTDEDGLLKLRKSELTAIGALINFRNRYLGHGMPLSKEEYADLYASIYPVFTDLLNAFSCLKEMTMIKSDRLNQFLLQGDQVKVSENNQVIKEDSIWIQQGSEKKLPLIPFYIIPGKFNAGHTDKTQVLVYEQNTGQRMVFYSPESIKAEATGEILERLQLLLDNKEKEEPYSFDRFDESLFVERLRLHNDKTLLGLKKEKKVIEGIYQSRGDAEMALIGWSGAQAGFFFLAAEAGSGKTNLLVHVRERYQSMGYPSILLRANRMEHADLHSEICTVLNIPLGSDLTAYNIVGTQEKPFMILLDGANEHIAPLDLLKSSAALADAFPGGGLKIVVSWRVSHLNQLPELHFSRADTLFRAEDRQHVNPLAAHAFLLKPMNLVELEGAWKAYTNHVSKQYKPQFSFEDLLLADKPLVDQLSNPLLLRICMEIFHNKGLKSKPKGFTNLWKLWWQQIKNDTRESEYLQQLASLLAESRQLQVPLDRLFDHPGLSNAVNNLQVDSPHQQLLRKGIISQFFHEGILQVTFTMEAAYHYVLSVSLTNNELGEKVKESSFWEGPVKYKLWDEVYNPESTILFDLIDDDGFPNKLTGFALAQYVLLHGSEKALQKLLSHSSIHDWEVLAIAVKEIETSRPKEHVQLANCVFDFSINEYHDESLSLLISLLQHADKSKADELYGLFIDTAEISSVDSFRALAEYHDKYGRNREALSCLEEAVKRNQSHELYRLVAEQQMQLGLYKQAIDSLDMAYQLVLQSQTTDKIDMALLRGVRGELYKHQSFYPKALSEFEKAHSLYLEALGTFHKQSLLTLLEISRVYQLLGGYDKSLELADAGTTLSERALGRSNPIYSDFLQQRGDLFNEKGLYNQAIEQYEIVLAIELNYFGNNHPYISGSYSRIGDIWETKGDYDKALDFFERSMTICLQYYGEFHPNVGALLDRIGGIWNMKGDYDKALDYFERSMAIRLQYYGETHPNVATSLNCIGDIWETKGDYDKAMDYFERSMAIRLLYFGESHPNVGVSLDRIGDIWNTKGDYDKALNYFERSLAIRLQYYGEIHPVVGSSLDRIGDIWNTKGFYDKALDYFERSTAICLQYYGESHPNVALSLIRIGDVWNTKGDYDKALDYFERSMSIRLQYYGESHPNVTTSLNRIGDILETKGDYDKALDCYERSMAIRLEYYGASHPNVGASLDRIGGVWNIKGDYDKALDYFERSMVIDLHYYGELHPNVATSLNRIGDIWNTKGNFDKALDYFERSLTIRLECYGESHPNVATSLNRIGDIWETKGDYIKALDYYERSMAIRLEYYGESHPNVSTSLSRIGDIWNTKCDYDKALDYFERSMAIDLQFYGESHPNVGASLDRIGDIWCAKGDYDKALDCFERSMAISLKYKGESHPDLATSFRCIGDIWDYKGNYITALEFYERSIAIDLQFYGESHPNVGASLNRIGDIWNTKGDYDKALDYFERSMAIALQFYGESHPNVGWIRMSIGEIFQKKNQFEIAHEQFKTCLEIFLPVYGQESRDVAKIKRRLGFVTVQMGSLDAGINLIKQSLATLIASGLEKDISLATAYMNLSTGYRFQENYTEALESIDKAIEIFHDNRGEFHVDTAEAYVEYAQVFLAMENLVAAKEYFQKAHEIRLAKLGDNHPDTVDAKRFLDEQN